MFAMRWMLIALLYLLGSCANKVTPTGGPKDTDPPKVLETSPEQGATSFKSTGITITFDEFVSIKEASRQVLVSPPVFPKPVISAQGKSVKVVFEKLADTTTYMIDFGNAIVDVNEGNPLSGYRFVFSTGAVLDTLSLAGKAFDLTTGKPLKGAIAMLYDAQIPDSVMVLRTPDHFARCNDDGKFRIDYVAAGSYRLVVLMEKTENYLLDETSELAGCYTQIITLPSEEIHQLWASPQPPPSLRVLSSVLIPPATLVTVFNGDARNTVFEGLNVSLDRAITRSNLKGDTISVFLNLEPDTVPVTMMVRQNGVVMDTVSYNTRSAAKVGGKEQSLRPELVVDKYGDADPFFKWNFPTPLRSMDSLKFRMVTDSVDLKLWGLKMSSDSFALTMPKPRVPGKYTVTFYPGSVTDIYGRQTDSCVFVFEIPAEKTRGAIRCKFKTLPAPTDMIQLLDDQDVLARSAIASAEVVFSSLPPGKYRIRLLKDQNANQVWDMGNIRKSMLPEDLLYHPGEITVRGNWDVDVELDFQ